MTDFQRWYATYKPNRAQNDDYLDEVRNIFEAGAASQAGTLRDKFAGHAMAAVIASEGGSYEAAIADWSYMMADAMLEARKAPEEDQGSRSDPNVLTVEITFNPTQCVEGSEDYDPEVDLQSVLQYGAYYNMTDWKVL